MQLKLLVLGLLFSISAAAEISEEAARKAKIEGYSMAMAQQGHEADKLKAEISGLKKDLDQTQKDAQKYKFAVSAGEYWGQDTNKVQKDLDLIQAHKTSLEKQLAAKTELLQKTSATYEENKATLEKTLNEKPQAEGAKPKTPAIDPALSLKNDVAEMKVSQKLGEAKVGLLEADKKILEIERNLDQADVGIYVKDKIGQLINSQLMCHGVNRCIKGKEAMPVSPDKVNEIFKNNTKGRSEYYYQMRGKQAPDGTK